MQFAASHCVLTSGIGFVVSIVLCLRTGAAVVPFSYLVLTSVTVGVRVVPGRPFVAVGAVIFIVVVPAVVVVCVVVVIVVVVVVGVVVVVVGGVGVGDGDGVGDGVGVGVGVGVVVVVVVVLQGIFIIRETIFIYGLSPTFFDPSHVTHSIKPVYAGLFL